MMRIGTVAAVARRSMTVTAGGARLTARRLQTHSGDATRGAARVAACAAAAALVGAFALASSITAHAAADADADAGAPVAAATAAEGQSDDDKFRSAQPFSDPDHPGLTLLTASQVDELVYRRNQPNVITRLHDELLPLVRDEQTDTAAAAAAVPSASSASPAAVGAVAVGSVGEAVTGGPSYGVLLDVYDPSCSACSTLRPVVLALAAALEHEPSVRVMAYDDEANFRRGFLSPEERRELPLLKFYRQLPPAAAGSPLHPAAREGVVYTGAPNTRALVDFIAAHSAPECGFDAAAVHARLAATAAQTDAALRAAADARLSSDPVFHIYSQSPCGPQMMDWMRMTLVSRYLSTPVPDATQKAAFDAFQGCMKASDKQMRRYWHQLAAVAQDNLSKYDEKNKQAEKEHKDHKQQQQQLEKGAEKAKQR